MAAMVWGTGVKLVCSSTASDVLARGKFGSGVFFKRRRSNAVAQTPLSTQQQQQQNQEKVQQPDQQQKQELLQVQMRQHQVLKHQQKVKQLKHEWLRQQELELQLPQQEQEELQKQLQQQDHAQAGQSLTDPAVILDSHVLPAAECPARLSDRGFCSNSDVVDSQLIPRADHPALFPSKSIRDSNSDEDNDAVHLPEAECPVLPSDSIFDFDSDTLSTTSDDDDSSCLSHRASVSSCKATRSPVPCHEDTSSTARALPTTSRASPRGSSRLVTLAKEKWLMSQSQQSLCQRVRDEVTQFEEQVVPPRLGFTAVPRQCSVELRVGEEQQEDDDPEIDCVRGTMLHAEKTYLAYLDSGLVTDGAERAAILDDIRLLRRLMIILQERGELGKQLSMSHDDISLLRTSTLIDDFYSRVSRLRNDHRSSESLPPSCSLRSVLGRISSSSSLSSNTMHRPVFSQLGSSSSLKCVISPMSSSSSMGENSASQPLDEVVVPTGRMPVKVHQEANCKSLPPTQCTTNANNSSSTFTQVSADIEKVSNVDKKGNLSRMERKEKAEGIASHLKKGPPKPPRVGLNTAYQAVERLGTVPDPTVAPPEHGSDPEAVPSSVSAAISLFNERLTEIGELVKSESIEEDREAEERMASREAEEDSEAGRAPPFMMKLSSIEEEAEEISSDSEAEMVDMVKSRASQPSAMITPPSRQKRSRLARVSDNFVSFTCVIRLGSHKDPAPLSCNVPHKE